MAWPAQKSGRNSAGTQEEAGGRWRQGSEGQSHATRGLGLAQLVWGPQESSRWGSVWGKGTMKNLKHNPIRTEPPPQPLLSFCPLPFPRLSADSAIPHIWCQKVWTNQRVRPSPTASEIGLQFRAPNPGLSQSMQTTGLAIYEGTVQAVFELRRNNQDFEWKMSVNSNSRYKLLVKHEDEINACSLRFLKMTKE